MHIFLIGSAISTERDVHEALATQLEFGELYGWNLPALRDRLLTDVPRPVLVTWQDSEMSRSRLGDDLYGQIRAIFEEARTQDLEFGWVDRFDYELQ